MGRGGLLGLLGGTALAVVVIVLLLQGDGPASAPTRSVPASPTATDGAPPALPAAKGHDARPLVPEGGAPAAPEEDGSGAGGDPTVTVERALLTGRVTRTTDGSPVVGVRVEPRLSDADDRPRDAERLDPAATRAVTDEDGSYVLAITGPCRLLWLDVASGPDTARHRERRELDLEPGTTTTFDVAVGPGATLSGTVVDAGGAPVPFATVKGWTSQRWLLREEPVREPDRVVQADAHGAWELRCLGPAFVLAAEGEGLAPHQRVFGTVEHGARLPDLELMVSPVRTVEGRVVTSDGRAVADLAVTLTCDIAGSDEALTGTTEVYRTGLPLRRTRSDEAGRFAFADLPSRPVDVAVDSKHHAPWKGRHAPGDGKLLVELEAGMTLTGLVLGADGAPVAEARVRLESASLEDAPNDRSAQADAEGRFTMAGLLPDEHACLAVLGEGHAVQVVQPVELSPDTPNEVTVRLAPERVLAGIVVDGDGAPVQGATISVEGDRLLDYGPDVTMIPAPTWERRFPSLSLQATGADGRFHFGQLYQGDFEVVAESPDDGATARLVVPSGRHDLRLVLDPGAAYGVTLVGRAFDQTTGLPVNDFFVTPMVPEGAGLVGDSEHCEDAQGAFRLTGLAPGPMQIDASAKGYAPWSLPLQEYEEGEHRLEIAFLPIRSVRLLVVDPEGRPLDVTLSFEDEQGQQLMVENSANSRSSHIQTGEDGEALAAGLPAAVITVMVQGGWLAAPQEYRVDLRFPPRDVVRLVYGQENRRQLLVVVVTGQASGATSLPAGGATPEALQAMLSGLMEDLQAGRLRPLAAPASIEVADGVGAGAQVVASAALDPAAKPDADGLKVPGLAANLSCKLEVPDAPGTLSVTAEGYRPVTRPWAPATGETGLDIEVVVLQEE